MYECERVSLRDLRWRRCLQLYRCDDNEIQQRIGQEPEQGATTRARRCVHADFDATTFKFASQTQDEPSISERRRLTREPIKVATTMNIRNNASFVSP